MKVNPTFLLRDSKAEKTSIVMYVRWRGKRVVFGTSEVIEPMLWDSSTMRATKDAKALRDYKKQDPQVWAHCDRINSRLNRIHAIVTDYFIKAGDNTPSIEEVKAYLIKTLKPNQDLVSSLSLNGYIDQFIKEIGSGSRQTTKGTKYAPASVRTYNSFRLRFSEFQTYKRKIYDFSDIDISFYEDFTSYLTGIGNRPNSTGKQIKCLKTILRCALDEKLHSNRDFQSRKFKAVHHEADAIYLTENELKRLSALELPKKNWEIARDVFLIGCYTAQRFSDYSRITLKSISKTGQGFKVIDLRQLKTGNRVIIPIKPELRILLEKYNYHVPHIAEQKLNQYIKEVGQLAGILDPIQITVYEKGMRVLKHVPKYSLIRSHSARRTGATLMHLAGIPALDLVKITGHKHVKELMRYIRVTEEETADKLSLHPYFRSLQVI